MELSQSSGVKLAQNEKMPGSSKISHLSATSALTVILEKIEPAVLKNIFSFLNIVDICIIIRVCRKWKRIIEKDPDIFSIVDLTAFSKKVNTLNLMKVVQSGKNIKKMYLPYHVSQTDTSYLLMCIPEGLHFLQINNLNIEFANVITHPIHSLVQLDLQNHNQRKKPFDENEIKAFQKHCPNLQYLTINQAPIFDYTMQQLLQKYTSLKQLCITRCPNITNQSLYLIVKYCTSLTRLELGGMPTNYNSNLSLEGFEQFNQARFQLEEIKLEYCDHVGDKVVQLFANKFSKNLRSLVIIRNCFEKCAKISDAGIKSLQQCPDMTKLQITYSRKFRENFHIYISSFLHRLRYLGIRECPLQEDLSVLTEGCPLLEEIDMSGDSYVTASSLIGLSKHPNLKVLHLGHYNHGDSQCDENLEEYPPDGMFIENLFKKQDLFCKLHLIYLEQSCSLTYWLDVRLQKIRPKLTIRYTPAENLFGKM